LSAGAASSRPALLPPQARRYLLWAAAVVCLFSVLPPLSHLARSAEWGLLLRYALYALVVPPLVVLGAPWRPGVGLAAARARHPELARAVAFLLLDGILMVWWFTPAAVRATAEHSWLTVLEAVVLIVGGIGLWLELVESPPLEPRSGPLSRAVLGAVAMWLVWIESYLVGLAHGGWYRNIGHEAGHGLSAAADQQVAAVVLWFVATVVFVPVIFLNALRWLRSEENPDNALYHLTKVERRRANVAMDPHRRAPVRGGG
jgi:cytochrome c oxidase assembly factor CtaG